MCVGNILSYIAAQTQNHAPQNLDGKNSQTTRTQLPSIDTTIGTVHTLYLVLMSSPPGVLVIDEQVLASLAVEVAAAAAEVAATECSIDGVQLSSVFPAVQLRISKLHAQQVATLMLRSETIRQPWLQHPLNCSRNRLLNDQCGADMVVNLAIAGFAFSGELFLSFPHGYQTSESFHLPESLLQLVGPKASSRPVAAKLRASNVGNEAAAPCCMHLPPSRYRTCETRLSWAIKSPFNAAQFFWLFVK